MKPRNLIFDLQDSESAPILKANERKIQYYGTNEEVEIQDNVDAAGNNLIYPKAVFFVLGSKFFESFAANGVRSILALYLRDSLGFSEDSSTTVLYIFNFLSQFTPLLGAIVADSYLGNSRTIFYLFFLYGAGYAAILTATIPMTGLLMVPLVFLALFLISFGNGGIRACVTSLGGAQFTLPAQQRSLERYFSHYYFVYTLGILISKLAPPSVRASTRCFGKDDCYFAVFGLLGGAFLVAWAIFMVGMNWYRLQSPGGNNAFARVVCCVKHAMWQKLRSKRDPAATHWLDVGHGRYGRQFVEDVKAFLRVFLLFLPLPVYWALTAQQDSTWTFQATQLNTDLGFVKIEPDQVKALGPALLLLMIPLMDRVVGPILNRCGVLQSPLEKVRSGGLMAVLAFVCAGALQIKIETCPKYPPSVLWQIPQFVLLMLGEVWLAIPGLQYSFTQAPKSMKSVLTASWFINNAIGNLIVVCITAIRPVESQSSEFFLYALLMAIGIILFSTMAACFRAESTNPEDNISYKRTEDA